MTNFMKKFYSVVVLICMLMSSVIGLVAYGATSAEFVKNGGFEVLDGDGKPVDWSFGVGSFGNEFSIVNNAKTGKASLSMKSDKGINASQIMRNLIGGTEYTLTANLKIVSVKGRGAGTKLELFSEAGNLSESSSTPTYYKETKNGEWQKVEYKFTLPKNTVKATLIIRLWDGGEVIWDDISFTGAGEGAVISTPTVTEAKTDAPVLSAGPNAEFIKNGDFEAVDGDGKPTEWTFSGGTFGNEFKASSISKSGKSALLMKSEAGLFITQTVRNLFGGGEYTLSANIKIVNVKGRGAGTKLELFGASGNLAESSSTPKYYTDTKNGEWQKLEYKITLPKAADKATIVIRLWDGGEAVWDDISFVGPTSVASAPVIEKAAEQNFVVKNPLSGTSNKLVNGNFEKLDSDGKIEGWTIQADAWLKTVSVVSEAERGNVIKLAPASGTNPWVCFYAKDVIPGAEYQAAAMLKTMTIGGNGPAFKVEFYTSESVAVEEYIGQYFGSTGGKWAKVSDQFVIPEGTTRLKLYARLYGKGEVYFDDVELNQTKEASHLLNFRTSVFNYSDWEKGNVSTTFNKSAYQIKEGDTVEFKLTDGDKVLDSYVVNIADRMEYNFKVSLLAEKKKAYMVSASYKDASGKALQTVSDEVYRYDRPTHLTKDGLFKDHNGEIFKPVLGYHVYKEHIANAAAAGINVLQSDHSKFDRATSQNIPYLLEYMDEAQKNGVKVLVVLYGSGNGGSKEMLQYTKACTEAVKNHPALFGYAVMDEPFSHFTAIDEVYDMLKEAYKAIHEIDEDHVVYICENRPQHFWQSISASDVMSHDPYPGNRGKMNRYVYDRILTAEKEPLAALKPIYAIQQAWQWLGYTPSANDMRHMAYQAFFAGVEGLGYYDVSNFYKEGEHLWERGELYEAVLSFKELEYDDAFKAFVSNEYPTFCEFTDGVNKNVLYKAFIKDNAVYIVLLNLSESPETVNVPLKSMDGTVSIGGFKADIADMSGAKSITGNGTLTVNLEAGQVLRYKITPDEKTDFSTITTSKFRDLGNYGWAKTQIDTLANKGIVNSAGIGEYSPKSSITRADFAMFLVRALELTADSTENFKDIDSDAYYAKEIAIGKALGILNGVGENSFNPNAEISRQDLMTICARGLRFKAKLGADGTAADVENFSDKNTIANYALASVAAMVREKIIKGNADGTINPLGNTTRAEAAVIMYRIMTK